MKKFIYLFLGVLVFSLISSCGNKKKEMTREEQIEVFRGELTVEDTTTMLKLADNAMEQLKAKKIDEVIASLYEYDDSTKEVKPLSEDLKKRYTRRFKMFPVIEYNRVFYSFMLEGCNDVKYQVIFATAEQVDGKTPATTMFMFNPVKVDGDWKLCVKTPRDLFDTERKPF